MTIGLSKRVFAGLMVAALAGLPTTRAFSQSTLEKAKSAGFIRAAIHNEPPYAYMTLEGKAAGLGPEGGSLRYRRGAAIDLSRALRAGGLRGPDQHCS
jgi:hypothetical protein